MPVSAFAFLVARIRRSSTDSYAPITDWPEYADHEVAHICRSLTALEGQVGERRVEEGAKRPDDPHVFFKGEALAAAFFRGRSPEPLAQSCTAWASFASSFPPYMSSNDTTGISGSASNGWYAVGVKVAARTGWTGPRITTLTALP
jgi:hypothetical protein